VLGTFFLVLVAVGGGMVNARFGGSAVPYRALVVAPALMVAAFILPTGDPLTLLVKALPAGVDQTARWANGLAGSPQRPPRAPRERRCRKHQPSGDLALAGAGTLAS
jgi:hypothetical protein